MNNWNLGGIADSKRQGLSNSSYTLKNCNIHEDVGILKCHQGLENDGTGVLPDEEIASIVYASNNKAYFFGKNGSVWVRNSSAVYSLLGEIPAGAAYGAIYDAKEFNGDLYYTMQQRVGKYTPDATWNTSTTDGTQNNFKNIEFDLFHPLKVVQNDLYVGHANKVGKIAPAESAGGAIADKLTLDSNYTVESFGEITRYLIIGTRRQGTAAGSFAGFSKLFKWDLVSNTYSIEREIKEFGISAFIEFNSALLFNAGQDGNLYSFDGNFAQKFKRIPGSIPNDTTITKNAWSSLDGITLFGVTQSGTSGVYSLGGYDAKYPNVFNLPFAMEDATVNAIEWVGSDLIFSYKLGSTRYLQKLSTTLATAETETLIESRLDKNGNKVVPSPIVRYSAYPAGTNVQLYASVNGGSYFELTLNKNSDNELTSRSIPQDTGTPAKNTREIQYKLILTPNDTDTPEIEFFG